MRFTAIRRAAAALVAVAATAACTVHSTEVPPLTGPSQLALTLKVTATPDSITQDGGSQASVKVAAIGPDGRPVSGLPIRVDMVVGGVAQDFGTLSARTLVTGNDGTATTVFTAPAAPPNGNFGTCNALPGTCVTIVATATSNNFATVNPQSVQIRLVPPGVILPPAGTPTAAFTVTPTPVQMNVPATFDASASTPGANATTLTYGWTFGDGATASGKTVTHAFTTIGTFVVTLTVTNERGLSASTTQSVVVSASAAPTGDFVVSPVPQVAGDPVTFNASGVRPAAGRTIVSYSWNFGDNTGTASGVVVTHVFPLPGTFVTVLTATDDAGQSIVITKSITVTTGVLASFTATAAPSPPNTAHSMNFDGSNSTSTGSASVQTWDWSLGDNTTASGRTVFHTYAAAGTFVVRLTVTDSLGRTATTTQSVTVP